ncbi:DUF928 domain-containing protein [Acaryochloris sp. IP29b_bin.137]|uniref:DUF928 domain-containing protein n=1 Tax=Acaryochloris sp. IP29b_bin.137 TaxID=2969217 RepID=UPI00262B7609|nr:DUF928 domain-containing protein [Acaryochloris sp. IP29b_bin.137]
MLAFPWPAGARRYKPPTGNPPDGSFGSNGSRGCDLNKDRPQLEQMQGKEETRPSQVARTKSVPITLLAPLSHVGRTSALTPTLAWFVSASQPYRVKVSIFTFDADQSSTLLHELEYVETNSGLVHYTLPEDKSNLQTGQRYFVELSVACDPTSARYNQTFIAEIDVEAPSPALTQAISQARTPSQKAQHYAEAGYWFDTVRELLSAATEIQSYALLRFRLKELAGAEKNPEHRQGLLQIAETLDDASLKASDPSENLDRSSATP